MKVDFTKAKVEVTFGEYKEMDIAKAVGNAIHQNTSDIGVDETCLLYTSPSPRDRG